MNACVRVILPLLCISCIGTSWAVPLTNYMETKAMNTEEHTILNQESLESMTMDTKETTTYESEKEEPVTAIAPTTVAPKTSKPSDCHHGYRVTMSKPPKHQNILNASPSLSQLWSNIPMLSQQSASALSSISLLSSIQSPYMPPNFYPIPVYLPYFLPIPQPETLPSHSKSNTQKRKSGSKNDERLESTQERHGGWQQKWDKQRQNQTDEYPVRQNIFKEWKGNWQNRTHLKEKFTKSSTTTIEIPAKPTEPTTTTESDIPKKHFFDELKQKLNNRTEKFNENSTEATVNTNDNEKHTIIEAIKDKFRHPSKSETTNDINPTPSVRLASETLINPDNIQNDTLITEAV